MELRQTKQRKLAANSLKQEKIQNLPLLCVELIYKFTPTSNLIRLYSNAVPLPGAFWDYGLKSVLKKRLPFSLGDDTYDRATYPVAVFDASGAKVASVKHPAAFQFAPVRELIEAAALSILATPKNASKLQLSVLHGESLLLHLPKVTDLTLIMRGLRSAPANFPKEKDLLAVNLKHLIPLLHSFRLVASRGITRKFENAVADFMRETPLHDMTSLGRLRLPERSFADFVDSATNNPGDRAAFLSGLRSFSVWQPGTSQLRFDVMPREGRLRFVSTHCGQVSTLSVTIAIIEVKSCLAALRELTALRSLSLHVVDWSVGGTALAVNNCETINSVVDLRFMDGRYRPEESSRSIFAIASLFPNVKAIAFEFGDNGLLASEFCTKRVLPALEKLTCFNSLSYSCCSIDHLTQFLSNPNLPEAVDLSQIQFMELSSDPGLLTAIYRAMQVNSTKSLLLRGPIHRESLPRLQSHTDLNGDCVTLRAWRDRDLADPEASLNRPEISPPTDIRIVGRKVCGRFDGDHFTIRMFHKYSKRTNIFD